METATETISVSNILSESMPEPVFAATTEKPATKPRKKRVSKHDFLDGNGRVFARKHDFGKGWVANTARVDDSVYVAPKAAVYQFAQVRGQCRVENRARVFGSAKINDRVVLRNNALVFGNAEIIGTIFLHDNVSISGNALVTGESTARGSINVTERACVINSTIGGTGRISGDAMALRSNISGDVWLSGSVTAVHATIKGSVRLKEFAQVLHSTVQNDDNNFETVITDFCLVTERSIIKTPIKLFEHITLVQTTIAVNDWSGFFTMQTPRMQSTAVITNQELRRGSEFLQFVEAVNRAGRGATQQNGNNWTTIGAAAPRAGAASAMLPAAGRRLIRTPVGVT